MAMPLRRQKLSRTMRFMLPVFPALAFGLAWRSLVLKAPTPDRWIEDLFSMAVWAALFAATGTTMVLAMVTGRRTFYQAGLAVLALSMGIWAGAFLFYGLTSSNSGLEAAAIWPAFAGITSVGAIRSLESTREDP